MNAAQDLGFKEFRVAGLPLAPPCRPRPPPLAALQLPVRLWPPRLAQCLPKQSRNNGNIAKTVLVIVLTIVIVTIGDLGRGVLLCCLGPPWV